MSKQRLIKAVLSLFMLLLVSIIMFSCSNDLDDEIDHIKMDDEMTIQYLGTEFPQYYQYHSDDLVYYEVLERGSVYVIIIYDNDDNVIDVIYTESYYIVEEVDGA